mmetsp:Transcript_12186/g.20308  ORF Transcript_12186/g.20308 Transcript_12186/m.20308 type:complete len:228 (-) Transcript_12186:34-717(-)
MQAAAALLLAAIPAQQHLPHPKAHCLATSHRSGGGTSAQHHRRRRSTMRHRIRERSPPKHPRKSWTMCPKPNRRNTRRRCFITRIQAPCSRRVACPLLPWVGLPCRFEEFRQASINPASNRNEQVKVRATILGLEPLYLALIQLLYVPTCIQNCYLKKRRFPSRTLRFIKTFCYRPKLLLTCFPCRDPMYSILQACRRALSLWAAAQCILFLPLHIPEIVINSVTQL